MYVINPGGYQSRQLDGRKKGLRENVVKTLWKTGSMLHTLLTDGGESGSRGEGQGAKGRVGALLNEVIGTRLSWVVENSQSKTSNHL